MRKLRVLVLSGIFAVIATTGITFASPAQAVCGGGEPGEACYCPDRIKVGNKTYYTGINC